MLLLKTLENKNHSRPPIWFMRQAGRCLKAYRDLKQKYDFKTLMTTPKLAAEVTLQPIDYLKVDAAILFSDILVIPESLGITVSFEKKPILKNILSESKGKLNSSLFTKNPLEKTYQAIKETLKKKPKNIPLIGFCGGPLTVFLYMWQGNSNHGNFNEAIKAIYQSPSQVSTIIKIISEASIEYALKQIKAGINVFQIFETWASTIPINLYMTHFFPYVLQMAKAIKKQGIPIIFFPRLFGIGYEQIPKNSFDAISIDWQTPLEIARKKIHKKTCLQGNLDPRLLTTDFSSLTQKLETLHQFGKKNKNWIINLGHGVLPETKEKSLLKLVQWVKQTNW